MTDDGTRLRQPWTRSESSRLLVCPFHQRLTLEPQTWDVPDGGGVDGLIVHRGVVVGEDIAKTYDEARLRDRLSEFR